jgi:hypothetical protein
MPGLRPRTAIPQRKGARPRPAKHGHSEIERAKWSAAPRAGALTRSTAESLCFFANLRGDGRRSFADRGSSERRRRATIEGNKTMHKHWAYTRYNGRFASIYRPADALGRDVARLMRRLS